MNESVQAVNYNHTIRSETHSSEISIVDYQTEEAKEVKENLMNSVNFNTQEATPEKDLNSVQYITIQSQEAECNNTLFFYL